MCLAVSFFGRPAPYLQFYRSMSATDRRGAAAAVYPRMVRNVLVLGLRDDNEDYDRGKLERSKGAAGGSQGADRGTAPQYAIKAPEIYLRAGCLDASRRSVFWCVGDVFCVSRRRWRRAGGYRRQGYHNYFGFG